MKIIACEQGSDAWQQARLGRATASRIADVVARIKTGWGASRKNYMAELISERLTGVPADSYTNAAMQWGIDTEPRARAVYSFRRDVEVEEVGFVLHPSIEMSGASPDGLVGKDGLVEIKCPGSSQHIETLLGQKIADKYIIQMQWQLACTKRVWCDFVSYDPRLPASMQMYVQRIYFDAARIEQLQSDVIVFLREVDATIAELLGLYPMEEAA